MIIACVFLLAVFGLAEIYSISLGRGDAGLSNFKKQVFFSLAGLLLLFVISFFDYFNLHGLSMYFYGAAFFMLTGVLVFGNTVRGTTGWFDLGFFRLQPVEFAKVSLLVFLARYFSGSSIKLNPVKHILVSGAAVFVLIGLVLLQPDFGSALLLFALWAIMVYVAGFNKKYIAGIAVILILVFLSGWFFFFKDYQKQRIMTFVNPQENPLGEGYNVSQAIIAVGSGGLTGRGIGFGSQSQLKFLPEAQNDFIFAVIAEELGFLGVALVILFFAIIFIRLLLSASSISDDFGIFFIIGAMSLIFMEMFINIGMNIGLLPVVGISLPFVSYGGSAIISSMIIIGIVESVVARARLTI